MYQIGDRGVQALSKYLGSERSSAGATTAVTGAGAGAGTAGGSSTGPAGGAAPDQSHGTVMVRDLAHKDRALIAHFPAHDAPLVAMAFNPSGTLVRRGPRSPFRCSGH